MKFITSRRTKIGCCSKVSLAPKDGSAPIGFNGPTVNGWMLPCYAMFRLPRHKCPSCGMKQKVRSI